MEEEEEAGEQQAGEEGRREVVRRTLTGTAVCRRLVWRKASDRCDTGVCVVLISVGFCFRGTFPGMIKSFGCTS